MSDLIERLREKGRILFTYRNGQPTFVQDPDSVEAAAEIERLTAELAAARAKLAQYEQAPVGLGDHVRVKQQSSDSDPKWLNDWRFPMDGSPAWHGHVIGLYMDYCGQIEATVTDEYCPEFPHRHARSGSTDGFPLSVLERVPTLIARPEATHDST